MIRFTKNVSYIMKKKLLLLLVVLVQLPALIAQSKNLEFNRVIDTIISVEVTGCTDIYSTPEYSNDFIVPVGKVWKITSLSNILVEGSSWANCGALGNRYFDCVLLKYLGSSGARIYINSE